MRTHTTKNNLFSYSVEKTKGKSRCTCVFIHDIGFDRRMWFPILTKIGQEVRGIAYDLSGFGVNARTTIPPHTIDYHVHNLFDMLTHLHIRNPVLIGVRFGAHIALNALRKDPSRFSGAMVGGVLPYAPTLVEYEQISRIIQKLPSEGSGVYADDLIASLDVKQENSLQLRHRIAAHSAHNIAAALAASLTRPSALQALLAFERPIFFLSGQNQEQRIQKEYINISFNQPNMCIIRIPESTTLCNLENPHAFHTACVRFITLLEK